MNKYLLTIEYDGTPFEGWQYQEGKKTIEGELRQAIAKIVGEEVVTYGSGRTDSGVHAIGQTAHFETTKELDVASLPRAINYYLPKEIAIKDAKIVDSDFHARYDVKRKTYLYKIYNSKRRSPLRDGRYMNVSYDLDIGRMKEAISDLVGVHDFVGMMTKGSSVKTTVREIYDAHIETREDEIYIYVTGSGFLYNMVRIIVGTLIDIGRGRLPQDTIRRILDEKDETLKGPVAKAEGLYLYKVEY